MFSYDYVLAAVLITAAPDAFSNEDTQGWFEPLQQAIVKLAVDEEILDRREIRFLLSHAQDFAGDLRVLRVRFEELASAPYLEECRRFPERTVAVDFLNFNRAYHRDMTTQLVLDPVHAEELREVLLETDRLHAVWDSLRDARCEYYYVTVRRHALHHLRELIGSEAFYRGQLPPHLPVWRLAVNR